MGSLRRSFVGPDSLNAAPAPNYDILSTTGDRFEDWGIDDVNVLVTWKKVRVFYLDKDGKKQDAALHEEMLNIDSAAEARVRNIGKQVARRAGLSEEQIAKLYK